MVAAMDRRDSPNGGVFLILALLAMVLLGGTLLAMNGKNHLKEGGRANERLVLATAVAAVVASETPGKCWHRPNMDGNRYEALALVIETGQGLVTFLFNGSSTFMRGDVPGEQLADWEARPGWGTFWQPCQNDYDNNAILQKLLEALEHLGLR